ncbi:hypothetical protein BDZ94DRAFT_1260799 [Collybia nuda]|uniref:RING-type domain-containing protein n=1 Tax=Collybia nuda TaxID=64659 RepID=A0A9P5Y5E6_9AGAR|nr:hypothetical protein BDZ94DRAFT_1260799 [Collybia nuda]
MGDTHERIKAIIESLPILSQPSELNDSDDTCPICLMSFTSLMQDSNPDAGVTKLTACNHVFCRRDLIQWIESRHGSCPTCRHSFLDIRPPSESDDESSDGGEYIPNEQEDEFDDDDDVFIDTDGFSDAADYPMELEYNAWEDGGHGSGTDVEDEDMENGTGWELTDEDSCLSDYGNDGTLDEDDGVGVASEMGIDTQNRGESAGRDGDEIQISAQEPK